MHLTPNLLSGCFVRGAGNASDMYWWVVIQALPVCYLVLLVPSLILCSQVSYASFGDALSPDQTYENLCSSQETWLKSTNSQRSFLSHESQAPTY